MELRSPATMVYDLDHIGHLTNTAVATLFGSLAASHAHCGEGFADNDRGANNRSFVLSGMDGLATPYGPVETMPSGPTRPVATTWLSIPSKLGGEAVMVNCVKQLSGDRWRLVRGNSSAIPSFALQPSFLSDPEALTHFMLGIQWSGSKLTGADPYIMRAKVFLLGGFLDCDARIFHSRDTREIVGGTFGGENPQGPTPPAAGPTPLLVPA